MTRGPAVDIEGEILDAFLFAESATLPASGGSGLYDKQRHPRSTETCGIQQCAKDLFLRAPGVNVEDCLYQAADRGTGAA